MTDGVDVGNVVGRFWGTGSLLLVVVETDVEVGGNLSLCLCVFFVCLNAGLTAAWINLIFGMHTLIGSDCAIG